jgi:hypothetical protein
MPIGPLESRPSWLRGLAETFSKRCWAWHRSFCTLCCAAFVFVDRKYFFYCTGSVRPTYMIPLAYWYSENYEQWQLQTLTRFIVVQSSICWIIGVVGFYLYVFLLNTESYRATIARGAFGFNAPVAGFTAAQIFVFVLCLVPIVAARIMQSSSSSTSTSTPTRAPRSPARTPRATRASSRSPARYSRA